MGRQVYQEGAYKVYRAGNDFIVHNARYAFSQKHTHIKTLNTAKRIIESLERRIIPKSFSPYLLTSLIRLSDDDRYTRDVEGLLWAREQKGPRLKYTHHHAARM